MPRTAILGTATCIFCFDCYLSLRGMSRASPDANETVSYPVKWVLDEQERSVPICMQSRNGPCALLALVNSALLLRSIGLTPGTTRIREDNMMALLADYISSTTCSKSSASTNSTAFNTVDGANSTVERELEAARQFAVADFFELLPTFARGVDINVRFNSCTAFEFTRELSVFDLMPNIRLVHGWLVDPQDARLAVAISRLSYNQVMNALVETAEGCVIPDGPSAPPLEAFGYSADVTIKDTYDRNALVNNNNSANLDLTNVTTSVAVEGGANSNVILDSNEKRDVLTSEQRQDGMVRIDEVDALPEVDAFPEVDALPEFDNSLNDYGFDNFGIDGLGINNIDIGGTGNFNLPESGIGKGGVIGSNVEGFNTNSLNNVDSAIGSYGIGNVNNAGTSVDTFGLATQTSNADTSHDTSVVADPSDPATSRNTFRLSETSGMGTSIGMVGMNNSSAINYNVGIGNQSTISTVAGNSDGSSFNVNDVSSAGAYPLDLSIDPYNFSNLATTTTVAPKSENLATSSTYGMNGLGVGFNAYDPSGIGPSMSNEGGSDTVTRDSSSVPAESMETANIREMRPLVVDFLESNSTQLTVYGLTELHLALNERETAILFRNSHFYVIRKIKGEIYTLVTDVGYINELNTVWEKLTDVTGDSTFYDGAFRPLTSGGTVQLPTPSSTATVGTPAPIQRPPTRPPTSQPLSARFQTQKPGHGNTKNRGKKGKKNNCTIQ